MSDGRVAEPPRAGSVPRESALAVPAASMPAVSVPGEHVAPARALEVAWFEVTARIEPPTQRGRWRWWPVAIEKVLATVVVMGLIAIAGAVAARSVADQDAINEAIGISDVFARSALEPYSDDVLSSTPETAASAMAHLDGVVHSVLAGTTLMRVKVWTPDGQVIYSDEPRLIGLRFPLDADERGALLRMTPIGEVSDLNQPENEFERAAGQLLEVYRPLRTPAGRELLVETYTRYSHVGARSERILVGFATISVMGLLLMHLLYVPTSWALARRLGRLQRRLDSLLSKEEPSSHEERRRIAGALHDGVVQDLAATSFVVAGSAEQARGTGQQQLAARLETAAAGVRASIGALRTLLVDIYPPNLRAAGLPAVLDDLANALRTRGIDVQVVADRDLELEPATQLLLYRVAQECLRNADRHSRATKALVRVRQRSGAVRLDVADDGVGFDPIAVFTDPEPGHFGVRVMCDLASGQGARLAVRTAPGAGTRWRLEVTGAV